MNASAFLKTSKTPLKRSLQTLFSIMIHENNRKKIWKIIVACSVLIIAFYTIDSLAQDFSFDLSEIEKKPYEYIAALSFTPSLSLLNRDSLFYQLKYDDGDERFLDDYRLDLEFSGSYTIAQTKLVAAGKYGVTYTDDEWTDEGVLYELYGQAALNQNVTLWLGKKTVKWGRGYIWNPAAFVGKQKDVNDVDANLEGYALAMGEFVKSFDSPLQTLAITPVIIPVNGDLNQDFSDTHNMNFALSLYFLLADTDIGLYGFADDHGQWKIGGDFARNLLTNWEIHAEWAYEDHAEHWYLDQDATLQRRSQSATNVLLGTRYLTSWNTTIIAEYLHNDAGFSASETDNFFDAADVALNTENRQLLSTVKSFQKDRFSGQFLMQDYLYLKISQPEPFDFLYFTPSAFLIYNLNDDSVRFGSEFKYSRFTNLDLTVRQQYFPSHQGTEFGEKMNAYKIELTLKKYF